nr:hypothetical protein [Tanacetum cinerariifolium]
KVRDYVFPLIDAAYCTLFVAPKEVTIKELASDKMGQKEVIHDSRSWPPGLLLELGGGCSWVRVSQETIKNPDFPPSAKPSLYKCSMELSESLLMPLYKSLWSGASGIALDSGTDMVKITKKKPKPDKNEREIVKSIQKPNPKTFLNNNQNSKSSSFKSLSKYIQGINSQVFGKTTRIEAILCDGHLRSCPSILGGVGGFRGTRGYGSVVGPRRIRVGSWNVGSLTGKLYELCDVLGSKTARNRVGVILAAGLKDKVVQVTRRGDRIMAISIVIDGDTVNVVNAYALQVGLRGDLNGHIRAAADGYARVHGGFGYGASNEEGRTILEFATAHDLVVANSFFKKSDAHLITFQSGGHNTQINYLLVRKVSEKLSTLREDLSASDADQMWNTLASCIKDAAKDSVAKQARFRELLLCHEGNQEDRAMAKERYKVAKREAKIAVAQEKDKAYEDLYKKLDSEEGANDLSKEGANDLYRIAKA